jgi:FAD:protein FMN transferase
MVPKKLLLIPLLFFFSCKKTKKFIYLEGQAQGTTFSIIYDSEQNYSAPIDSLLRVIDGSMSLWDSSSTITKINANNYGGIVDKHFENVFYRAMEVSDITGGYFDITVGPLVKAWGFSYKKNLAPPDKHQIDSLLNYIGYTTIRLVQGKINKEIPQTELDFNALAQGYTVDLIAEYLETKKINNYMVEIGGEVRAKGKNEKNNWWQIGIDKPTEIKEGERPLQTVVNLKNKSMATSGSYRKYIVKNGQKYSHAINPITGYPITHNLLSITVLASDCITSDAFATAFLVMGLEKTKKIAGRLGLEWYAILAKPNGDLEVTKSDKF